MMALKITYRVLAFTIGECNSYIYFSIDIFSLTVDTFNVSNVASISHRLYLSLLTSTSVDLCVLFIIFFPNISVIMKSQRLILVSSSAANVFVFASLEGSPNCSRLIAIASMLYHTDLIDSARAVHLVLDKFLSCKVLSNFKCFIHSLREAERFVLLVKKTYTSSKESNKSFMIGLALQLCSTAVLVLCAKQGIYGTVLPSLSWSFL